MHAARYVASTKNAFHMNFDGKNSTPPKSNFTRKMKKIKELFNCCLFLSQFAQFNIFNGQNRLNFESLPFAADQFLCLYRPRCKNFAP